MKSFNRFLVSLILVALATIQAVAQSVSIKEEIVSLDTYDFGKPNPVPILSDNPKIFPYFKFEEYQHTSQKKDWKVVTLENDYIKVFVLPEIGGKVWGAIEKSTGKEFLYKNKVVKFRNIAMRGPWTSGGIEFNFGIIGHHPSTATPVDYLTKTNADGSVSCFVGNIDLPSNTKWWVEIRLEKDKAFFETNASWYNASPLSESYYNWMTAAAVATYDLEFIIPGNAYVEHNGNAHAWPVDDKARDLSFYKNNTFGPSKSYHIVGEYNDFFGGYYHDSQFGFGQWAPYEEMPGQKLWLWDLSRAGGIWEDLLTDSDGQYIEFQAGRLFDQYSAGATNPISQVGFDPYMMDRWSEIWFPYKEIGGMVDASGHGVLNVEIKDNETIVGLNALQKLDQQLQIVVNGETVFSEKLNLNPMEILSTTITTNASDKIEVSVEGTELHYNNDPERNLLKRPFYPDDNLKVSSSEKLLFEGTEALEYRAYDEANKNLSKLIELDPSHQAGLIKLGELAYRNANYDTALEHANTVLRLDTYNSAANYLAGITYRAKKDALNALESFGWSARDAKYRSVSYAQMAELHLAAKEYQRAKMYAHKALDFNTYNLNARRVLAVVARKLGSDTTFQTEIGALLKIDPLNHFAAAEKAFKASSSITLEHFGHITNEFPAETLMGVAMQYQNLGMTTEALALLSLKPKTVKSKLWTAYLLRNTDKTKSDAVLNEAMNSTSNFVFPYRRETLPVLQWASEQLGNWKLKYYLAQNYLALNQGAKGKSLIKSLGNTPDSDVFYRFRAKILEDESFENKAQDYQKAMQLNPKDWKVWEETIQFYQSYKKFDDAYKLSLKAYKKYPGNYNIGLAHAKSLVNTSRYSKTIDVLKDIRLLPYEHASESRVIYESAHLGLAQSLFEKNNFTKGIAILQQSKLWPENIGSGKPFSPDERMQNYMLALGQNAQGETALAEESLRAISEYDHSHLSKNNLSHLFSLLAYKKLGLNTKLDQLTASLKETSKTDSKAQLILAFYNNDKAVLGTLKKEGNTDPIAWKIMEYCIEHPW
ncbi:DUF5107 domain-containing protein [Spongiimicrobium sp. 3-5]|uniref:DUF5107 domain-containing protein n=1 Tax=Spongiimicrobium sp. 3-5 TaxID=3332596 RepID=UPI0039812B6B